MQAVGRVAQGIGQDAGLLQLADAFAMRGFRPQEPIQKPLGSETLVVSVYLEKQLLRI